MTVDSLNNVHSASLTGLNTYTYNVPATGRYKVDVQSMIPWQTNDAPTQPALEVQDITAVADSSGSLNSTFFTFYLAGNRIGYYVWFNINSAGVDPAPAGLTGIQVAGATNATAATLAGAARTAIALAVSSAYLKVSGATTHIILTNLQVGSCTAAANGTASPGFSYSLTQAGSYGAGSGLQTVVNLQGTPIYSLYNPSPTQPSLSGSVITAATAGDVITVVTSSIAPADQLANAVKTVLTIFLVKG